MRGFVVAVVLLAAALYARGELSNEQKQKIKDYITDCISETDIDREVVDQAHRGMFQDDDKLPEFSLCMSKKMGFRDDSNRIRVDVVKEKISEFVEDDNLAKEIFENCFVEKSTPEESALESFKCFQRRTPDHFSFL
ncbi:uncharacterized protein LOC115889051 [Sitophilus oryzae]|uniref:Uncharacterized protein LOC115889051 n=1 Tax=Sitophilus oryzae TaxID=7048 RepID=A0A6J2YPX3_SITOR|nr:uncharacterized protein LOC115889051 [Sitophilus oryzae]